LGNIESGFNTAKTTKSVEEPQLPQGNYLLVVSGDDKQINKPFIKF
jgi:hypothetical protein